MMASKTIEIHEEDIKQYSEIMKMLDEIEKRIANLEITKMFLFEEYKRIKDIYIAFADNIKIKYKIPVDAIIMDVDNNTISYEEPTIS